MSGRPFVFPKLYAKFAKYYDQLERQYRDYAKEAVWLREIFDKYASRKIVDVSCGTASHLANLVPEGIPEEKKFFGIDASEEMVRLALKKLGPKKAEVSIARADFLHPPYRDESFDAALCMYWSLAGLNENLVKDLFFAVNSVLEKGGIFVLDTENAEGIKENLLNSPFIDAVFPIEEPSGEQAILIRANFSKKVEADRVDWHAYYMIDRKDVSELETDRMSLRFYSRKQLENLLSIAGFKTLEVLSGPFLPYKENSPSLYFVAQKSE